MAACTRPPLPARCARGLPPCDRRQDPNARRCPAAGKPAGPTRPPPARPADRVVGRWNKRTAPTLRRSERPLSIERGDGGGSFRLLGRTSRMTLEGIGSQRKRTLTERSRISLWGYLDTSSPRQYFPG